MTSSDENSSDHADQVNERGDKAIVWFMVLIIAAIAGWYGTSLYLDADGGVSTEPRIYNGHTFVQTSPVSVQTVVRTAEGEVSKEFREYPGDIDHYVYNNEFSLPLRLAQESNGTVYVSVGPDFVTRGEAAIASIELVKVTSGVFGIETKSAVTQKGVVDDKPVVTCENATPITPVIKLVNSSETLIQNSGSCITLEAKSGEELIEIADVVAYSLLGIIE